MISNMMKNNSHPLPSSVEIIMIDNIAITNCIANHIIHFVKVFIVKSSHQSIFDKVLVNFANHKMKV